MPKNNTQQYDTVIKKNLQEILPGLINELLGTNYRKFVSANVEIPTTLNKKSDLIFEVRPGGKQILHIEFQSGNDADMPRRMHLYAALLYYQRKDVESVRQIVFYVGKKKMAMQSGIEKPDLSFRYQLIDLKDFSYRKFLDSAHIEVAIFALLADLQQEKPETVVREIVEKLRAEIKSQDQLANFLVDLEILAQLRNFEQIVHEIRKTMMPFDLTKVSVFQEGIEQGIKQGITNVVRNMRAKGLSVRQIAEFTEWPEAQIQRIADEYATGKPAPAAKRKASRRK